MEKTEISTAGFFSAIYLSILVGVFMYMSNTELGLNAGEQIS